MQAHRIETTVAEDGIITLRGVPFRQGEAVEIIVLSAAVAEEADPAALYPLRGTPFTLIDPTEPVAEDDWEAAN